MVPGLAKSTQCVPAGKPYESSGCALGGMRSSLEMNLKVDAGAMILGCVALRPMEGEKGAGRVDLLVTRRLPVGLLERFLTKVGQVPCSGGCSLRGFL